MACADAGGVIQSDLDAVTFCHKYTIVEIMKRYQDIHIKEVGSDVAQVPRILQIRRLRSALYDSLMACADARGAILKHPGC